MAANRADFAKYFHRVDKCANTNHLSKNIVKKNSKGFLQTTDTH